MKPHLLQYLRWKERLQEGENLNLSHLRGTLSYVLAGLLTTKVKADDYDYEDMSPAFSADLFFDINSRRVNEGKIVVEERSVYFFSNYVHRDMHEMLLDRIVEGKKYGKDAKEIIYAFMLEIGLDDYISYDAMKQANYRLRMERKIPNFYSHKRGEAV